MLSILTKSVYCSTMLRSYNVSELFLKVLSYNNSVNNYCKDGLKRMR